MSDNVLQTEQMPEVMVPVQVKVRGVRTMFVICLLLSMFVGRDRAARWFEAGAWRMARCRVGSGPWQRVSRP